MNSTNGAPKKRISIMGAGPAGLAAAWSLTATEELRATNDVTVYQVGWRAGGKCATGRRDPGDHVEQNCAHYLFGCYDNTFGIIREAYDELAAAGNTTFNDFDKVLLPRNLIALKQYFGDEWKTWLIEFPENNATPGTEGGEFLNAGQYAGMMVEWMLESAFGWQFTEKINKLEYENHNYEPPKLGLMHATVHGAAKWWMRAALSVAKRLHLSHALLGWIVATSLKIVRAIVWAVDKNKVENDLGRQRKWSQIDYGCTTVIGLVKDKVLLPGGFEGIDHLDFRDWLASHGGTKYCIDSPFVLLWYQNSLAYKDGDFSQPSMSAACALLAQMRAVFTYKGSVAFSLENEIGDTFIAPLYLALKARGVNFRFFHRLRDVVTDDDYKSVTQLVVERQIRMANGDPDSYDPFINVHGHPCWPDVPNVDQFNAEDRAKFENGTCNLESFYTNWRGEDFTLVRGQDFDEVVFALPHSVIPEYCNGLYTNVPEWKTLVDENPTIESQSDRLWFKPDLAGIGWPYPQPVLSGYELPYCTWEDDGQLIKLETWPADQEPQAIACVFGPLAAPKFAPPSNDQNYLKQQESVAAKQADQFETELAAGIWPDVGDEENPNGIDPDKLVWKSQRANSGPLERYTMTWPGALQTRPKADGSGVDGLIFAGDWTRNGLEAGSIEGAMMSGMQASRAICGYPKTIVGENDSYL